MKRINTEILGSLQSKVMEVIWKSDRPLKPSEVLDKLDGNHAYTTVMTILKRLAEKKVLQRKLVGKAYVYSSVSCQKDFVGNSLKDIFGDLVNSYGSVAIANFVDVIKTNQDDLTLLKDYLKSHR